MFGKRVTDIVRKLTRPSMVKTTNADRRRDRPADRPGRDVEPHGKSLLAAPDAAASGTGRTRSPGRRKEAARATTLSPARTPLPISTASPSTIPGFTLPLFDLAVAHDIEPRRVPVALERGRRHANAIAAGELDLTRGEGADMGVADVFERNSTLPVRLALSTSWSTRRTCLSPRLRRPAVSVSPACR